MKIKESINQYGVRYTEDAALLQAIAGVNILIVKDLLHRYNNCLGHIAKATTEELQETKGIGEGAALRIVAALEIGRRRQKEVTPAKDQISSSIDAYEILAAEMRDMIQEEFHILLLDRRSRVIAKERIHTGGMAAMVVDPKIIFQHALRHKAQSVILCHNHPSGSPSPSNEDQRLTEKVKLAGNYIDIKVLDHIIIGDGSYYSFADEGKI